MIGTVRIYFVMCLSSGEGGIVLKILLKWSWWLVFVKEGKGRLEDGHKGSFVLF